MLNRVELIGRLGKEPELREMGGKPMCRLRMATDGYKGTTDWHDVVVWNKRAEACAQYLSKGRQLYISGRIQHRSWTDQEGQKRRSTEIVADNVLFLGGRSDSDSKARPDDIPDEELGIPPGEDFEGADVEPRF